MLAVLKCEIFVQKEGYDAAGHVVGCGGKPVALMKQVIQGEHDACTDKRIDDADQDELPEGSVKETLP